MARRSARQTALAALRLWRKEKSLADSIISGLLADADLAASDRAFALKLFYGVLRNLTLLDFWIGCLRASQIEANVRDMLRLGLYQLFLLKTPEHAAVNETVTMASQKQRPIINAVLRAAIRQRSELLQRTEFTAIVRSDISSAISGRTVATTLWRRVHRRALPMGQPGCAHLRQD